MPTTARVYTAYKPYKHAKPRHKNYRKSRKRLIQRTALLIIVLFGSLAFARVTQEVLIIQSLDHVNELKAQIENTIKQKQDFEYRLSRMTAPGRIKSIAVNKLGMAEASKAGYILLTVEEGLHQYGQNISKEQQPGSHGGR